MMRYMVLAKATKDSEAGAPPDPRMAEAVDKLAEDMKKAGVLLLTGGLAPSSQGFRVEAAGGKLTVVDGPFAETTELLAGFAIIQAKSKEEAIEWGRKFMKLPQDVLGPSYQGSVEVRALYGADELG
jgi:hypothetical protein